MEYKYYDVQEGCMGLVNSSPDRYKLFSCEDDYKEWYSENKKEMCEKENTWYKKCCSQGIYIITMIRQNIISLKHATLRIKK